MDIIPVIDLKGGQAVHARLGERARYAPLRSRLCRSADPPDVARGYLSVYPFDSLYVADLDAIEGRGDNRAALERLRRSCPGLRLWVDSGLAGAAACRSWLALGLGDLVLGSETQRTAAIVTELADEAAAGRVILSLDFRGEDFLGPPDLLACADAWPARILVMTLARVGSGQGPDLARLRRVLARAAGRRVFAAGGVAGAADLARLAATGAAGVLVASALHDGRLGRRDIEAARDA